MLRHEFQPGRLVAGLFMGLAGFVYAGDAGGLWDTPWFAIIPIVVGGLCLAGATATVAGIRKGPAGRGDSRRQWTLTGHITTGGAPGAAGTAQTGDTDEAGRG
ncbi:hypothetical protein GCM10018785_46560 [Streptomyces longispororuber]|uniref:Uncharacterized protein n=1 Tax=Streptomyces longispororuber TaxID=68230 RepID=A0A918ZXH1_9ACTN|nr:hypothetical protein [Streptomyces longispororuber]GHE73144.1 hypothetical protein GCM10018785_46560 [Streptomyces longispororuber]